MKTLLLVIYAIISINSNCYSQLPESYPFKTTIDNAGNLFVTGDTLNPLNNTYDFVVRKFNDGRQLWEKNIPAPYGNDKGMDIALNESIEGLFIYATGYMKNNFGKYEILIVKLNTDGDTIWTRKFPFSEDGKGLGITLDLNGNAYITGYVTTKFLTKDIVTLKYTSSGVLLWSRFYNNPTTKKDDFATDIIVDHDHVYVMGSTYNGSLLGNDIILINYDLTGSKAEVDILEKPKTNETPTAFIITEEGLNSDKSRISITSVSDKMYSPVSGSKFLTVTYDGGATLDWQWEKTFARQAGKENVATAIETDKSHNVYVTGYCYTDQQKYDFATIKYNGYNGNYLWQDSVLFYDIGNGNDRASSIKVLGDSLYVSGSSQFYPGGFRTISYTQSNGTLYLNWDNVFIPSFDDGNRNLIHRASVLNIDPFTRNVIVMAMSWDGNAISKYAIRGYSPSGSILYTIDYGETDNLSGTDDLNSPKENFTYRLSQNYPNPFNPNTIINYQLKESNFVTLKVYDILGNEVANLVNEKQVAGSHSVEFNGANLQSGIYFYRLETGGNIIGTMKMILLK